MFLCICTSRCTLKTRVKCFKSNLVLNNRIFAYLLQARGSRRKKIRRFFSSTFFAWNIFTVIHLCHQFGSINQTHCISVRWFFFLSFCKNCTLENILFMGHVCKVGWQFPWISMDTLFVKYLTINYCVLWMITYENSFPYQH